MKKETKKDDIENKDIASGAKSNGGTKEVIVVKVDDIEKIDKSDESAKQEDKDQKQDVDPLVMKALEDANYLNLKAVAYGHLLETFTKLGIPEVWKAGTKKDVMIANALEKLTIMKDLAGKGVDQKDLAEKTAEAIIKEKVKAIVAENKEEEIISTKAIEVKSELRQKIESMGLSDDQIVASIENIDACLKMGIVPQRMILLNKKVVLEAIQVDRAK